MKCEHFDYLEIACTFRYPVKLTLKSGATVEGVARDTGYSVDPEQADHQECLILDAGKEELRVATDLIASMETTVDNPHFSLVNFDESVTEQH